MQKVEAILERERLQSEERMNKRIEEMQGFIFSLGHDLRSPIVTIKTFLGYLTRDMADNDKESVANDLGFIESATDKIESMLECILDYSRVGRLVGDPIPVTFQEIIREAQIATAGKIFQRRIEFRVIEAEEVLFGDRHRLSQIWQNLIDNAAKYMGEQKEPCIEVGVEKNEGADIIFFVRDNGIGIDPSQKERIFNLFSQLDSKSEGIGFGLALVKRIVDLYGGKIWAESEGLGKGACFRFTLPKATRS